MNVLHAKINVTYTVLRFWEKGFSKNCCMINKWFLHGIKK